MSTPDRFSREFRSRMPVHAFGAAGLVFLGAAIWKLWLILERGGGDYLLLGYYALFGAWLVSMFPGRSRPILEISADQIRYGSATWPSRRSIPIDEIVEVGEPSRFLSIVRLRLRSGKQSRLHLGEIRAAERAEAVASIREAMVSGR